MTHSDYHKMLNQLVVKPAKFKKFLKHNKPKKRDYGKSTKHCRICGNPRGHIGKYGINICRRCFREVGEEIGFRKY